MASREAQLVERAPNLAPPPDNPRFPLVDGLRAIAALTVFLGHTLSVVYPPTIHPQLFRFSSEVAREGVAIFFIISGFLLYRPFLVSRANRREFRLGGYAVRRVARIVPAYWVALSVFLLFGLVDGVNGGNWWVFYGFGQVYSRETLAGGLPVAWTLSTEVAFYIVLPLVALAPAVALRGEGLRVRRDALLLFVLSLGSLAVLAHFNNLTSDIALQSALPGTFLWFALGMGLALLTIGGVRLGERWRLLLDGRIAWPAALVLFACLYLLGEQHQPLGRGGTLVALHVLYGLVALLIAMPGILGTPEWRTLPLRLLGWRSLRWIGLVSYGFYLYHAIVISRVERAIHGQGRAHYVLVVIVSFVLTALCAAASYYAVERPILRAVRLRAGRARREVRTA